MSSLNQNRNYNCSYSIYNALSKLLVCLVWILVFFGGSIKANISSSQRLKNTSTAVASTVNKADLPVSSSDPIQLPEESEFLIAELDDQADDDKKIALAIFSFQFFSFKQTTDIQTVQSVHYKQAIQQILPIPLFVLHHSWKSYLV